MKESIADMYHRGLSIGQIARTELLDEETVRKVLHDSKVKMRYRTPEAVEQKCIAEYKNGVVVRNIAWRHDISEFTVYRILTKAGVKRDRTAGRKQVIPKHTVLSMKQRGMTSTAIAKIMGVNIRSIHKIVVEARNGTLQVGNVRESEAVRSDTHDAPSSAIRERTAEAVHAD